MDKCFAMAKGSMYTCDEDRGKPETAISCYVLRKQDFKNMVKSGYCGTKKCPFFKEKRGDVR